MFPGRSNKSEGGAVCLTENGRADDLSLTPNDPDSRQANPRRKERLPYSKQESGFT